MDAPAILSVGRRNQEQTSFVWPDDSGPYFKYVYKSHEIKVPLAVRGFIPFLPFNWDGVEKIKADNRLLKNWKDEAGISSARANLLLRVQKGC